MNYFIACFSIMLGLYSMPLALGVFRHKHDLTGRSQTDIFLHFFSCFMFVTFPLVNFASAAEMLLFSSYNCSYLAGAYGLVFVIFHFSFLDEGKDEGAAVEEKNDGDAV